MLVSNLVQPLVLFLAVVVLTPPLGAFIARVMGGERTFLHPVLGPVERLVYRGLRLQPDREQTWKAYARSLLVFSLASIVGLYVLQRVQGLLPVSPDGFGAVDPYLALNTAVSFVTNTDWQNYVGEATMSQLTQMAGLAVQNFVSAGVGLAVAVALIRGLTRRRAETIGNFWVDLTRGVLFVLLPLSILLATLLLARGVVQNFNELREVRPSPGPPRPCPAARSPPGGDQGARYQRRRAVQRQLGAPVREPRPGHQLPGDAGPAGGPVRAHRHLRPHGRLPPPGAGRCSRPWPSSGRR